MAEKLTVIIPCKDEQANIIGCIHSARKVADEILIADSGSSDQTLDIVRALGGARIIEREYVNSGNFKNWAIPQASHNWVLVLDADERIPDELADEINDLLSRGPGKDGYWVYRASFFMGHRVRFSGWQHDRVLRLFRREVGRYEGETDHAEVAISSGRVSRLKHRMLHYSYWTYHDYFQRMQRYSTYQALKWQEQGRPISLPKLFFNLPLRFLQLYFLRLGFLDGLVGFQICALTAMYSFSKQACLWQLWHGHSRAEANRAAADVVIDGESLAVHGQTEQYRITQHRFVPVEQSGNEVADYCHARIAESDGVRAVPLTAQILKFLAFQQVPTTTGQGCAAVLVQPEDEPELDIGEEDRGARTGRQMDENRVSHGR